MSRVALTINPTALIILFLAGTGTIRFNTFVISSQMLNGIGAALSAIFLLLITVMDLTFIVLIARTPNRWWHP